MNWFQWQSNTQTYTATASKVGMFVGNKLVIPNLGDNVIKAAYLGNTPLTYTYSFQPAVIFRSIIAENYATMATDNKNKACCTGTTDIPINGQTYNYSYATTIPLIICSSVKQGYFYASNGEELYADTSDLNSYFNWDNIQNRLEFSVADIKPTSGTATHSITLVTSPTAYYKLSCTGTSHTITIKRRVNNNSVFNFTMLIPNSSSSSSSSSSGNSAHIWIYNNFITTGAWTVNNDSGSQYGFNFIQTNSSWKYLNNPYVQNCYIGSVGPTISFYNSFGTETVNIDITLYAYNATSATVNDVVNNGTAIVNLYKYRNYIYGLVGSSFSVNFGSPTITKYIFDSSGGKSTYLLWYGNITKIY